MRSFRVLSKEEGSVCLSVSWLEVPERRKEGSTVERRIVPLVLSSFHLLTARQPQAGHFQGKMAKSGAKECWGYAAYDRSGLMKPFRFMRRPCRPEDICFQIKFCGICHTDLHQIKDDWKEIPASYPMVPGHEVVGIVCEVGGAVRNFKPGDRIGVGCISNSCGQCDHCRKSMEQYCERKMIWTYNDKDIYIDGSPTYGGYSTLMVIPERYALRIPEGLPLDAAAPLLCAGITVYSPMKHYDMERGGKSFGVIGLGGLGFMAAKFARALGMRITVVSTSPGKEQEARTSLHADNFVVSTDPRQMKAAEKTLDFIIDTVAAEHSMDQYLPLLKTNGKIILVGIPAKPLECSALSLHSARRCVGGSLIGGIRETQEMLDFCARHHIFCKIERIPISYVNEAMVRLAKSDVKYRFVIDVAASTPPEFRPIQ
ncbi:hypothetical protein R1flu_006488 [Riccia fluitans]|uniref:Enoyl reductase (ER) domain-containing protein n=1 Tax=Riccia fluitans TaxID=41844 RepID=A0ABD1YX74_9MARC